VLSNGEIRVEIFFSFLKVGHMALIAAAKETKKKIFFFKEPGVRRGPWAFVQARAKKPNQQRTAL